VLVGDWVDRSVFIVCIAVMSVNGAGDHWIF